MNVRTEVFTYSAGSYSRGQFFCDFTFKRASWHHHKRVRVMVVEWVCFNDAFVKRACTVNKNKPMNWSNETFSFSVLQTHLQLCIKAHVSASVWVFAVLSYRPAAFISQWYRLFIVTGLQKQMFCWVFLHFTDTQVAIVSVCNRNNDSVHFMTTQTGQDVMEKI